MLQPRTHFEQVPLEVVRKIVEEELRREKAAGPDQLAEKATGEKEIVRLNEQSGAPARVTSTREVKKQS